MPCGNTIINVLSRGRSGEEPRDERVGLTYHIKRRPFFADLISDPDTAFKAHPVMA